jgi:hypothetical protein
MNKKVLRLSVLLVMLLLPSPGYSWHDRTHIAVAKAAGYQYWFNVAGPDIAKVKAGDIEVKNHYFDNDENVAITDKLVLDQIQRYNKPNDREGHLYGAIIAAVHDYLHTKAEGKYAEYPMAFAAHYVGDLSQPLHNVPYDGFNKEHHQANDGIVEDSVLDKIGEIEKNMYEIKVRPDHLDEDLAREIVRIAKISRDLAAKMKTDNRNMTKEEAFNQLGHSASLLKAVLRAVST